MGSRREQQEYLYSREHSRQLELQTNNLCDTNGANCVTPAAIAAAVAAAMPSGMIAAFATTTCPSGWSEYTAARGAFLRGIDNGAGAIPLVLVHRVLMRVTRLPATVMV